MKIRSLIKGKGRILTAAVVAAVLSGGAFAFANSLSVSTKSLGSGSPAGGVASPSATLCQPTFTYTSTWDNTNSQFDVTTVLATANGNCYGDTIQAEITGSGGTNSNLPYGLAATPWSNTNPSTATWTLSGTTGQIVPALAVTNIYAVETGSV